MDTPAVAAYAPRCGVSPLSQAAAALTTPASAIGARRWEATTAAASAATTPTTTTDEATTRVLVYDSPLSMPIAVLIRLAAAKCVAAGVGAVAATVAAVDKVGGVNHVWEAVMGLAEAGAPALDMRLAGALAAVSVLGGGVARGVARRTVVRLEVDMPEVDAAAVRRDVSPEAAAAANRDDPWAAHRDACAALAAALAPRATASHVVTITRPGLLAGTTSESVPRSAITCAPPSTLTQCFLLATPTGRRVEQYLFPTAAWRSTATPYLKALMYDDYFDVTEAPPRADSELVAIEGFGRYRPAQIADPLHPAAAALEAAALAAALAAGATQPRVALAPGSDTPPPPPDARNIEVAGGFGELVMPVTAAPVPLRGTPFTLERGTVWATFTPGVTLSRDAARLRERDVAQTGASRVKLSELPRPAAPVTLMLDGSQCLAPRTPLAELAAGGGAMNASGADLAALPPAVGDNEPTAAAAPASSKPTTP